jgi:kelch-like protein 2/3
MFSSSPEFSTEQSLSMLKNHVDGEHRCRQDFIIEAMKFHLLKGDLKLQMSLTSPRTKPRQPVGLPKVMLAIGGQAPKAIRSVSRN